MKYNQPLGTTGGLEGHPELESTHTLSFQKYWDTCFTFVRTHRHFQHRPHPPLLLLCGLWLEALDGGARDGGSPPSPARHGEEIQGKGGCWLPSLNTNIFMRVNKWPWRSVWGGRVSKGRVTQRMDCILGGTPGKSLKLVRCNLVFFFFLCM